MPPWAAAPTIIGLTVSSFDENGFKKLAILLPISDGKFIIVFLNSVNLSFILCQISSTHFFTELQVSLIQSFKLTQASDILVPIGSIIDSLINPPSELNPPDIVSQIAPGKLLIFSHHHLIPSNNICGKCGIALNISINAGKPVVFNHSNTGFKTLSISFF